MGSEIKGVGLLLVAVVASVWLATTGQLGLYIHPRYIMFTTVMAAMALLMVVIGARYGVPAVAAPVSRPGRWRRSLAVGSTICCGLAAVSLVAIRPAALTSSAVNQRGMNTAGAATTAGRSASMTASQIGSPLFSSNNYSELSVKDWAGLLSGAADPAVYTNKQAQLTGFVVADQNDPRNVFFISRFVVTCCVVDARPVGVAVYSPGWQQRYKADSWVQVSGGFKASPSATSLESVALLPTAIKQVNQPERPYDF